MGDVEPRLCTRQVRKVDHDLQRDAGHIRKVIQGRAVVPPNDGRVVCLDPIHEAQGMRLVDQFQPEGVEHSASVICRDVLLLHQLKVAQVVPGPFGISGVDRDHHHAVTVGVPCRRGEIKPDLPLVIGDVLRAYADADIAGSVIGQAIATSRIGGLNWKICQDKGIYMGDPIRHPRKVSVLIQQPGCPHVVDINTAPLIREMSGPFARRFEDIQENLRRAPVRYAIQPVRQARSACFGSQGWKCWQLGVLFLGRPCQIARRGADGRRG